MSTIKPLPFEQGIELFKLLANVSAIQDKQP